MFSRVALLTATPGYRPEKSNYNHMIKLCIIYEDKSPWHVLEILCVKSLLGSLFLTSTCFLFECHLRNHKTTYSSFERIQCMLLSRYMRSKIICMICLYNTHRVIYFKACMIIQSFT